MVTAKTFAMWYRFAEIGIRVVGDEINAFTQHDRKVWDPPLSYFVFRGVMAEARGRAKNGLPALDKDVVPILQSALGKWNNYEDEGREVKLAVSETHKAAARLKRIVPKGAAVVAIGSSPDKIGFVLDAAGVVDVSYVSFSRTWLVGDSKKRLGFDELFDGPLRMMAAGRRVVMVDYADKFSTLHFVDGMMRKWHPDLHGMMQIVVLYDYQSDNTHLQAVHTIGAWKTIEIHPLVWHMSKSFRCTPTIGEDGSIVAAKQEQVDACDAVRCLLVPRYALGGEKRVPWEIA